MRKVEQCSDEMNIVEKKSNGIWDEKRWAEIRWEDFRWHETKCGVWSVRCGGWSVKCGVWRVQYEVWSVERGERSVKCGVASVWHLEPCATFAQSLHARAALAQGARKFYRWKRSYGTTLRQLPPRLVRVLLVKCKTCAEFNENRSNIFNLRYTASITRCCIGAKPCAVQEILPRIWIGYEMILRSLIMDFLRIHSYMSCSKSLSLRSLK